MVICMTVLASRDGYNSATARRTASGEASTALSRLNRGDFGGNILTKSAAWMATAIHPISLIYGSSTKTCGYWPAFNCTTRDNRNYRE